MRVLELFCGVNHSFGRVAESLGLTVISRDVNAKAGPILLMDILEFEPTAWPSDYFQFVWASPPCESYSPARTVAKIARADAMQHADRLVAKTRQIIAHFSTADWCIENPATSLLWKRDVARGLIENSVVTSYCCFGADYRKNTRIASSFPLSLPKCPGIGKCAAMVGSKHRAWGQKGGGGCNGKCHTVDELHSIPSGLIQMILGQIPA